jgi:hypothetical protein
MNKGLRYPADPPSVEEIVGRFGHVWARFGRWSSVEFAGVGDIFRDTLLAPP